MIRFIDLSSAQRVDNQWDAAHADGVRCAWIKASEGRAGRDPNFAGHRDRAQAAQIRCGPYHFCRPNAGFAGETLERDARGEAEWFFACSDGLGGTSESMPPLVDFEAMPKALSQHDALVWFRAHLERVQELWGVVPWVYTGAPMRDRGRREWDAAAWLREYPLLIAAYPLPGGQALSPAAAMLRPPPSLPPWDAPTAWQHSGGGGNVPGNRVPGFGDVPIDCGLVYLDSLDDALVTPSA